VHEPAHEGPPLPVPDVVEFVRLGHILDVVMPTETHAVWRGKTFHLAEVPELVAYGGEEVFSKVPCCAVGLCVG